MYEWKWTEAEGQFKRAIELNPGYGFAHLWYGILLCQQGRFDEGKEEMGQAVDADPLSLDKNFVYAHAFYWSRDYDQYIAILKKVVGLDPNWMGGHYRLSWAYELKGMPEEAWAELLKYSQLRNFGTQRIEQLTKAYEESGFKGTWLMRLRWAKEVWARQTNKKMYPDKFGRAIAHIRVDEKEETLHWLQQALDDRDPRMCTIKVDPIFDALRSDPRFILLQRNVGLIP